MALTTTPSWFKGRQGTAEAAGENSYRLTAPNVPEAFIGIRRHENGLYSAWLRTAADGPESASEPVIETEYDAWEQAFELYREALLV
jgi:hypothetical protein